MLIFKKSCNQIIKIWFLKNVLINIFDSKILFV